MKWFYFVVFLMALKLSIGLFAPYFDDIGTSAFNTSAVEGLADIESGTNYSLTESNQYVAEKNYLGLMGGDFLSKLKFFLVDGLGTVINNLFGNFLPGLLVLILDVLYYLVMTLGVLEFLRGMVITQ
jgi:hypothetical protein